MLSLIALLLANAGLTSAATATQPILHTDDTWRYKNATELRGRFNETHDDSTVVRVQGDAIVLRLHGVDSTLQPTELLVGSDWSRFRSVNGKEVAVNRPFAFPLTPSKTWTVDYTEQHPNRDHLSEHLVSRYTVVGPERVTVAAGTFDAIKVEGTGTWTAVAAPAIVGVVSTRTDAQGAAVTNRLDRQTAGETSGRLYRAFWYVPAVKRAVKTVEEYYDGSGVRYESHTSELESFRVAE